MGKVFVGRQPILDSKMHVFAYELQFHHGMHPDDEIVAATERLIEQTEAEIGFSAIVGHHVAMMRLPRALMKPECLPQFDDKHPVVVELANTVVNDAETLKNVKRLRAEGIELVLDDYIETAACQKLAVVTEFVKVDPERYSETKLKEILAFLHQNGVKVIAQKVTTGEMFQHLQQLGFDYFQGYFFNNPIVINGEKLSGNSMNLLQLMAKVNAPSTEFSELAEILSQDVGLSHKLLVAVNNPAAMIPVAVESVADALRYMGLKRLKFWINMLLLSGMEDAPQELLTSSLIRARFCEGLALASGHARDKDSYFLVGLFSNLGAFFHAPIAEVVADMPLAEELKGALVDKKGLMGEAIQLLEAFEQGDETMVDARFEMLTISQIGNVYLEAAAWAQQAISA